MDALAAEPYVSLATHRRDGTEVRTPVWVAGDPTRPSRLWVYTNRRSGKVKRLRHDANVRLAPCDVRGTVRGPWYAARAELVESDVAQAPGFAALLAKYGWQMRLLRLGARLGGRWPDRIIIAIDLAAGASPSLGAS